MNNTTKNILRWIAVLPASILGSFIGNALAIINGGAAKMVTGDTPNTISLTDIIMFFAANILAGAAFVLAGTFTAPNHRKATSIVLTSIFAILATISSILEITYNGISKTFFGIIISFVASVVSCVYICNKENEDINPDDIF